MPVIHQFNLGRRVTFVSGGEGSRSGALASVCTGMHCVKPAAYTALEQQISYAESWSGIYFLHHLRGVA